MNLASAQIGLFSLRKSLDDVIERKTQGMAVPVANNIRDEMVSAFHENVINGKVVLNAENAKQYYDVNKKEILPENREGIEKVLETEDTLQFAQTTTDQIILQEGDRSKWAQMARESTDDPEKRKETVDLIKTRKKELDQLDKEAKEAAYLDALDKIDISQNQSEADLIAKRIEDPIDRAKALKVSQAKFEKKTADLVTDRDVEATVYEKIDSGEITTVRQLIEFSPDLSTSDYKRLQTEVRNKQNPDAKAGFVKYTTAKTAYETIKGKKYDVEKDSKEFMFVQSQLDEESQVLGRDLTPDEAVKAAARAIVKGESIGTGFFGGDPNRTLFEASQEGTLDVWLPVINDEGVDNGQERREIKEAFRANGIDTDNEELFRIYKKSDILNMPLSEKEKTRFKDLSSLERIKTLVPEGR
jgi:hypothetical protein